MKLAIHSSKSRFHPRWVTYCQENNIPYKLVNCHATDIIEQLKDCDALLWHHAQSNPGDILIAKQILFALEHSGFKVFPDFKTSWHFDDKVGQKYLFEALNIPTVPSYVFVNKSEAVKFVKSAVFPKVFKLRGGAGSANVQLAKTQGRALHIVNQAFGSGFSQYSSWTNLKDRIYKYRQGKSTLFNVLKGIVRFVDEPEFSKIIGKERGYVYFQDFMPNNDSDTRIIIIDGKAFALKRMVRKGDFRASGSGEFYYSKEKFDERCVKLAFESNEKIQSQCIAYDFIFDSGNNPLIVEISYGFIKEVYDPCPGYWDKDLIWHEGKFNAQGWMIESVLKSLKK